MLLGVLSDTHDRLPAIDGALAIFRARGVQAVLHPGDLVAPFAARRLLAWTGPLHVTYGNNDGERKGLRTVLPMIQDGPLWIDIDGRRVLLHHAEEWCRPEDLARADIVVTGHSHEIVNRVEGGRLRLNPGECCGWVTGRCTVAIVDTRGPSAEIIEVNP